MPEAASGGKRPFTLLRWLLRWELRRLRLMIARLRRWEGTLSHYAEQGGAFAGWASARAADLGCILTDHLGPAADALEKAVASLEPLPVEESSDVGDVA